jgi:alanyl-tRNA synthetase
VTNTGEVGIIKLLDFIHYKGGIRIHMHCGLDALEDYRRRYTAIAVMAAEMSVKQADVTEGFARMQEDIAEKKQVITSLREQLLDMKAEALLPVENSLCLFEEDLDAVGMRRLLNRVTGKCGALCGVFVGNDASGYRYVIGRGDPSIDLKARAKELNTMLRARGGGSSEMLQGQSACTREEIERVFAEI